MFTQQAMQCSQVMGAFSAGSLLGVGRSLCWLFPRRNYDDGHLAMH